MTEAPPAKPDVKELASFGGALAALFAVMLLLSDGEILFQRPLWVDEVFTVLVAGERTPAGVLSSLAQGTDGGAGLVHLSVWALQQIVGVPSPVLLRALSFLCVFGALMLTFAVLRRRFGPDASVAGAMAVGAHYLVVTHTYEARFYGPWLLGCAFFAWAMARHQALRTRGSAIVVAVAAVLLCTAHFYGVITLGLMVGAIVATHGRRWRDGLRLVTPASAGLAAVLAILPIALGIRSAYTVRSWVPEFELRQLRALASTFWLARLPLGAAVALAIGTVLGARGIIPRRAGPLARHAFADAGIVALASLLTVPLAMALVSILVQPATVFRYSVTTTLAWAPLVALALELLGRWPSIIARLAIVVFWWASYVRVTFQQTVFAHDVAEATMSLRHAQALDSARGAPIVFQSIHTIYPVWAEHRARADSIALLELPDSAFRRILPPGSRNERYSRGVIIDRDMARIHRERYGFPRLAAREVLDTTRRFYLVAPWQHLPLGFRSIDRFAQSVFPRHRVSQVDPNLAVLELR